VLEPQTRFSYERLSAMTWQEEVTPEEWDEWQSLASDL
jgi:hypothetical protein